MSPPTTPSLIQASAAQADVNSSGLAARRELPPQDLQVGHSFYRGSADETFAEPDPQLLPSRVLQGANAFAEPGGSMGMGVLHSINNRSDAQFVYSYQLDFSGDPGVYASGDFIEENNILFAIARRNLGGKMEYYSLNLDSDVNVSLHPIAATEQKDTTLALKYSPKEAAAIKFGGPIISPSLDDGIIFPPVSYHCNTIKKQKMSYDSLSSIGAVTQEGISVSATNTTGSITFETTGGAITDVGGLYATGERENLGAIDSGTPRTATIRSGY
tara:strand:+ start:112 stop:927 length:816 start_codon:yes stop_codon:yes gene_type:complete